MQCLFSATTKLETFLKCGDSLVQYLNESKHFVNGNEVVKQRIRHLRQNLARAANRPNPQHISITLDELYEVGEHQQWQDPFSGDEMQFTRGGNWGLKNAWGTGASNPLSCSIDRIDSDKGYVSGNVQLVTAMTNMAKGNMSNQQFVDFCKKVANNHKDK